MESTTEIPLTRRREVSEEREGIRDVSSNRRKTAMQSPWYAAEIISDAGKSEGPHSAGRRPELISPMSDLPPSDSIGSQAFLGRIVRDEAESAQNAQEAHGRDRRARAWHMGWKCTFVAIQRVLGRIAILLFDEGGVLGWR